MERPESTETPARDDDRGRRLGGLGERVAAVAHELKVPLSLIIGSLESLEQHVSALAARIAELDARVPRASSPPAPPAAAIADNASALMRICREGADRLERVVQDITAYARGRAPRVEVTRIDVARALRTTVDLVARSLPSAPPIRLDLPDLPFVSADEPALGRAIVNLLRNACDAVADRPDPLVRIGAGTLHAGGRALVEIRIVDNGPGIPAADRERVFEPFVTGKAFGAGLGLGLTIAKELVEMQQGTLDLEPSVTGTAFVIRLPVAP